MDNYKEAFLAYMDEKGIKYQDLDERAVRLSFHSDVVPQGVDIVVIFDKENHHGVHFLSNGFCIVPENKFGAVLMACNEANATYRWAKFYVSDKMSVCVEDDAILDFSNVGAECAEIAFRLSDIIDEVYPSLMKAIYS